MKRVLSVIFAFICAAMLFCGCSKSDKSTFEFPETAAAEYERAYTLNNGKAYDFATLKTFTLKQTVSVYSPELAGQCENAYPTTESRIYRYDARGEIKSQISVISANFSADIKKAPEYTYYREAFVNNRLCEPWFSQSGQSGTAVEPLGIYADYNEYLQSGKAFDPGLRNIKAYPLEYLTELKGGVTDDKTQYIMTAQVASESFDSFFGLLTDEYDFRTWYAAGDDGSKQYNCFLDPGFIKRINVTVTTDRYGVKNTTVAVTATPAPEPIFGLEQDVTVTFNTEYSTAEFAENTISANFKD